MQQTIIALLIAAAATFWAGTVIKERTLAEIESEHYILKKADWDPYVDVRDNEVVSYYKGDR